LVGCLKDERLFKWLGWSQERAQLKMREKEIAEAQAARRRKVTVTFDLLGRQVVLSLLLPCITVGGLKPAEGQKPRVEAC
jgi:hypothetical protein